MQVGASSAIMFGHQSKDIIRIDQRNKVTRQKERVESVDALTGEFHFTHEQQAECPCYRTVRYDARAPIKLRSAETLVKPSDMGKVQDTWHTS